MAALELCLHHSLDKTMNASANPILTGHSSVCATQVCPCEAVTNLGVVQPQDGLSFA